MQFHFFAPLLLIPLAFSQTMRQKLITIGSIIVLLLVNMLIIALIVVANPGLVID